MDVKVTAGNQAAEIPPGKDFKQNLLNSVSSKLAAVGLAAFTFFGGPREAQAGEHPDRMSNPLTGPRRSLGWTTQLGDHDKPMAPSVSLTLPSGRDMVKSLLGASLRAAQDEVASEVGLKLALRDYPQFKLERAAEFAMRGDVTGFDSFIRTSERLEGKMGFKATDQLNEKLAQLKHESRVRAVGVRLCEASEAANEGEVKLTEFRIFEAVKFAREAGLALTQEQRDLIESLKVESRQRASQ